MAYYGLLWLTNDDNMHHPCRYVNSDNVDKPNTTLLNYGPEFYLTLHRRGGKSSDRGNMAVVTLSGGGCHEVGISAARLLNADYVDRLILAEAAKRIGSSVEVLALKEERSIQLRDRIAYFFQTMLERSAMSGAGGEPYFSPGMEYLPSEEYIELAQEPVTAAQALNDQHFIDVTSAVIKDLAKAGDVVIIGRGSNMILRNMPGVLHVGVKVPTDVHTRIVMEREHLAPKDAEKYVSNLEKARVTFYRKFFNVNPDDYGLYHLVLNLGTVNMDAAAEIIALAARRLTSGVTLEST